MKGIGKIRFERNTTNINNNNNKMKMTNFDSPLHQINREGLNQGNIFNDTFEVVKLFGKTVKFLNDVSKTTSLIRRIGTIQSRGRSRIFT